VIVHLVDIGGIVDNHCLNFHFILCIKLKIRIQCYLQQSCSHSYMWGYLHDCIISSRGRHGRDRVVVGFTITYGISSSHH